METTEKTTNKNKNKKHDFYSKIVKDPNQMGFAWELRVEVNNALGSKAFGGRMLASYLHPLTNKTYPYTDTDGKELVGYNIDKPTQILRPRENPQHAIALQWLLTHPEVAINGIDLTDAIDKKKKKSLKITLTNLDFQETSKLDDEETIDRLAGRLSLEGGKDAIGLERLRYLLAFFNLPYRDKRYITNAKVEKQQLRKRIKDFSRTYDKNKVLNATKVIAVIDEIDNFKINYEVKEMMRLNIINESNNVFKYNNIPLGTDSEVIITFFKANPEVYMEALSKLAEAFQQE